MSKFGGALFFAGVLAISGCSGSNGSSGTNGTNGMSAAGGKLKLTIDGVTTDTAKQTSTMTFTVYPAATACPGGTCDDKLSMMGQKTFYATEYDAATKTFTTAHNISYSVFKFKGITADGTGAQYTATNDPAKSPATFAPESSKSAMAYGYLTGSLVLPVNGNYKLYDGVASAAKVFGTVDYQSTANVSGCEKCHGKPYSKHGYRQATVAGLNDFVACKSCHTDQRKGGDLGWFQLGDDPAAAAAKATPDAKYAYTAKLMNDVHASHAFEFNYPQSMANCVTCHEGKLDQVLTDANFKPTTCKSCHPVTGPAAPATVEAGRAPAMMTIWTAKGVAAVHPDLYAASGDGDCNGCHKDGGPGKTFSQLHAGYNKLIYFKKADGTLARYSDAFKADISNVSVAANVVTFTVTVTEAIDVPNMSVATIAPLAYVAPYGYGTKDFLSSKSQDLTVAIPPTGNGWTVTAGPVDPSGKSQSWTVTADLGYASWTTANGATWASQITSGVIKRIELAVRPQLPNIDGIVASGKAATVALNAVTSTFDLVNNKVVTSAAIVDTAKCNACHDALGTTFHTADRGGTVTMCRICHVTTTGAGSYEMQSRSIDSFIHAIHSMQGQAIGSVKFGDAIEKMRYADHIEGNFPNFAGIQNCESCHLAGTYEVPDQTKSLPSIASASAALFADGAYNKNSNPTGGTIPYSRNINGVPSYVTGPASRACGSCHRAQAVNEDDIGKLVSFNSHTGAFGTLVAVSATPATDLDAVTQNIMAQLGGPAAAVPAPAAGMKIESCEICHPTAGADHQARFNAWRDGTVQ
jgi:OmcA/MtrC family decaheme c-type cytochrome